MKLTLVQSDSSDVQKDNFDFTLQNKLAEGFVVLEKNEKLPYVVLRKEKQPVDHFFNFVLCCVTLGLWSVVWVYYAKVASKTQEILIAIDEDGNTFQENCYLN